MGKPVTAKGEIIRLGLARALFDASPELLACTGRSIFVPGLKTVDGEAYLARSIVAELEHAGWTMRSARRFPEATTTELQRRVGFEEIMEFGVRMTPIESRACLGDDNRAIAGNARTLCVEKILEAMNVEKVVLGYRARHRR